MSRVILPRRFAGAPRSRARKRHLPQHGLLIFVAQVALLVAVPLADTGSRLTPGTFVLAAQATAVATIFLLGYRRVGGVVGIVAMVGLGWAACHIITLEEVRLPPALVLIGTYVVGVFLCVQHAFVEGVESKQRIYCGCAGYLMVGLVFAGGHALAHVEIGADYFLPQAIEGAREARWIDFVWLSYSTLTTAGFSDIKPVGGVSTLLCTLEGLCGILFPATLIARIASLTSEEQAAGRSPKTS
jgi:hypothetical protein